MRVVAGRLGGRLFASPHGHKTRPMSDKIRGALFNALGDISNLTVLDAFSGSGALSIEAVSRGAAKCLAIEIDASAQNAISKNIRLLNLDGQIKLIKANASSWLKTSSDTFDIILVDPPYDNIQPQLLFKLCDRVKPNGIIVLSLPPNSNINLPTDFSLESRKSYGDAELYFYKPS